MFLGGSLEALQVHENKIRALPRNIAGLAGKLRVLNLRKNQLRSELTGDDAGAGGPGCPRRCACGRPSSAWPSTATGS